MERKLIITREPEGILTTFWEDGKAAELRLAKEEGELHLGDIYIGKVKKVVKNIQAAFIEVAKGVECYYSIQDNPAPIYTGEKHTKELKAGDELLVQVSRESAKSKVPTVTSCLNFTGTYVVLTWGKCAIGVSAKIPPEEREALRSQLISLQNPHYGFIIRTNARDAAPEEIRREARELEKRCMEMQRKARYRTCFTKMSGAAAAYLESVRDAYRDGLKEIVTDDKRLYEELHDYLAKSQEESLLRLYQDSLLPLSRLYGLRAALEEASRQRVWLKSGAYLVIQPTEALTVIDVNTGKYDGKKKNSQDTFLKINLEAAKEAARQLRLRNLSGIVIIDFINLSRQEDRQTLLDELSACLKRDPITTVLVDMTPLNLVEITRKKVRRPLHEQLKNKEKKGDQSYDSICTL